MAELLLYMGPSGCGKTTSLRNLPPKETVIITPNSKSFPFPGADKNYIQGDNLIIKEELDDLQGIMQHISDNKPETKVVVVEDFTHFFSARIFSPAFLARNSGGEAFARWMDFGASVYQSLFAKAQTWRSDLTIVILHHTEVKNDGTIGFKTAGKLLDDTIDVPSYLTWIFHGRVLEVEGKIKYVMQTNKDTVHQAKSPYGVFPELLIPNDLNTVINRIRAFKQGKIKIEFID